MQTIHESEFMVLLIGIGVLAFIILNWKNLKPLATRNILLLSFCALIVGWTLTILEEYYFEELLNFFEHTSFAASAFLLLIWCWREFTAQEGEIQ